MKIRVASLLILLSFSLSCGEQTEGNLLSAYEVPNYALLLQAAKTGPSHNAPALLTAVQKGSISVATWAGQGYKYMGFAWDLTASSLSEQR